MLWVRLAEREPRVHHALRDPETTARLLRLLGASEALGEFLIRRPEQLDLVLDPDAAAATAPALAQPDPEVGGGVAHPVVVALVGQLDLDEPADGAGPHPCRGQHPHEVVGAVEIVGQREREGAQGRDRTEKKIAHLGIGASGRPDGAKNCGHHEVSRVAGCADSSARRISNRSGNGMSRTSA